MHTCTGLCQLPRRSHFAEHEKEAVPAAHWLDIILCCDDVLWIEVSHCNWTRIARACVAGYKTFSKHSLQIVAPYNRDPFKLACDFSCPSPHFHDYRMSPPSNKKSEMDRERGNGKRPFGLGIGFLKRASTESLPSSPPVSTRAATTKYQPGELFENIEAILLVEEDNREGYDPLWIVRGRRKEQS